MLSVCNCYLKCYYWSLFTSMFITLILIIKFYLFQCNCFVYTTRSFPRFHIISWYYVLLNRNCIYHTIVVASLFNKDAKTYKISERFIEFWSISVVNFASGCNELLLRKVPNCRWPPVSHKEIIYQQMKAKDLNLTSGNQS